MRQRMMRDPVKTVVGAGASVGAALTGSNGGTVIAAEINAIAEKGFINPNHEQGGTFAIGLSAGVKHAEGQKQATSSLTPSDYYQENSGNFMGGVRIGYNINSRWGLIYRPQVGFLLGVQEKNPNKNGSAPYSEDPVIAWSTRQFVGATLYPFEKSSLALEGGGVLKTDFPLLGTSIAAIALQAAFFVTGTF